MKKAYSANDKLRDLAQNLEFRTHIFDDPYEIGTRIKLREESKNGEIDAILLHKNIVCLVGVNKGRGKNIDRKIKKFFEKLDKIEKVDDLRLTLDITVANKKRIKSKKEAADRLLEEIKNYIKKTSNEYNLILRKIFFCPNKQLEEEVIKRKQEKELVIDKDIFEYFQEVLNRLDKRFLFNDFVHFSRIKKVDFEKKGTSKTRKPPKSAPFKVDRLQLEKDKIIMYSLSLRVEDIRDHITVLRVARKYDKKGFQRMVKLTRLNKINKEYLSKNETFPNNIIVALNPELYTKENDFYDDENKEITFLDEYNSLIIIDGQHRFFSFVRGEKLDRRILVTLVFFKNGNEKEKYLLMDKMFYKINKTQERIDPNLSFILLAKIDPDSDESFWYKVFKKLDKKGFFAHRFSFKETTMRKGEYKKSIISVVTYGGALRLNRSNKRKGVEVDGLDTFYGDNKEENVSFAFDLLKNYFDIIETVLYSQGVDKNELTPREIGALLRVIKHFVITDKNKVKILGSNKDITKSKKKENKDAVKYFEETLGCIPFDETIRLDYPASNWAAVEGYIIKKIHKEKSKFGDKNLLSPKGLEVYENTQ